MSQVLLIYSIILSAIIALVSGIFLIGGLGWALVAFSASAFGIALLLNRGLINEQQ